MSDEDLFAEIMSPPARHPARPRRKDPTVKLTPYGHETLTHLRALVAAVVPRIVGTSIAVALIVWVNVG
jgi:hypothetical protein